ncbi:P-loop ATPase, Sll1717 family [Salipiger bermudensis]|uniref:P-loop ATPase, Sll1717 family n=1 Tax=Salipiger bermudensis TaxID=344736 RepID=UPI001A8E4081|nr:hypothetical protein [Salipiger bermudensis]MBN9678859.1 hypothetical protein [Salipiger bermudensis]
MQRKISCFVSFSATDGDEDAIKFLLDHLSRECDGKIEFKAYFNNKSGSDLGKFMKEDLLSAHAVLALFSPDYKMKCDQHIRSGVLTEYMFIVDRLEGRQLGKPPLFIPVVWKANFDQALPSYFNGRELARDLSQFKPIQTTGPAYLPDRTASRTKPSVDAISSELLDCWRESDPELERIQTAVDGVLLDPAAISDGEFTSDAQSLLADVDVNDAFFRKAERTNFTIDEFSKNFFVKTGAFRAIGKYHKIAFTGRKGSGKTTLLKVYKHQNSEIYFDPIDVEVNDWNLHYLLQDLTFKSAEGDLTFTAEESKVFDYIWPIFLSLCMVKSVKTCGEELHVGDLLPKKTHSERFENDSGRYEALFNMSVGVVREFIEDCISSASTESESRFKSDLLRLINVQSCTEFLLGSGYHGLIEMVRRDPKNRKFLFCLDRFDTEIQKYRKDIKDRNLPEEQRRRWEQREIFWIQGLVELIDHLRSPDNSSPNQEFYKMLGPHLDFCVPLPRDRLYEVQLRRRDAIVGEINEEISWQPYELLTMLRKRLQVVWDIKEDRLDKSRTRALGRFRQILKESGRSLPDSVDVKINGAAFSIDLFLNVLRHSFFRPRDVLLHYTRIVARAELANKRNEKVSPAYVARIISEQTHRIVEEEFLGEFADTFTNLREILDSFKASQQILTYDQLRDKLQSLRFEMYGRSEMNGIGQKVRFLYEVGFLGIRADSVQLGGVSLDDFDFYFFNPRYAQNLESDDVLKALVFAIHPIFIEHLTLKMNSKQPVMMLSWDQVEAMDVFD